MFSFDRKKVVLVESKRTDNWCCPKGSRERRESTTECALRELHEEAGISLCDIDLLENVYVDEMTARKTTVGVRYRVAILKEDANQKLVCKNTQEILQLGWYTLKEALALLKPTRQDALNCAIEKVNV